jgi:RecA-family ATPase
MASASATIDHQGAKALEIFRERCEARSTLCANGLMPLIEAVDTLQSAAEAQGLVARYDRMKFSRSSVKRSGDGGLRMNSITPSADRLACIGQDVALAAPEEKLQTFVDRADTFGKLVRQGFFSAAALEQKLWDVAIAYKLTGSPGSEAEEYIGGVIGEAVAIDDEPRAPNGHDDEPPPPTGPDDYGSAPIAPVQRSETNKTGKPKRDMPRAWWRDPASIPPRSSLYDGHYIRRTIGTTIGGGGRAKTTRGIYEGISMAVGFDIATKDKLPAGELRVWICNGEEDQDELDRRVAAACQRYGISQADLGGRLFVQSVRDTPLRIATLVNNRPVIDQAVVKYMVDFIERDQVDVFIIDPLVSFHGVLENDNSHMDLVIKEGFGAIANRTNSAGELFHHPGKAKPGQADTTVEDGRGASSILWAVRSARVFNFMTPEEATKLGLSEDERRLHIRIANGKANMGPLGKAKWLKLVVENLPNGDLVACASPWTPPDPFKNITATDMELARTLARTGAYRSDRRSPEWFGYALAKQLNLTVSHDGHTDSKDLVSVQSILKKWLENKVLDIEKRKDDGRKERSFIIPGPFKPILPATPPAEDYDEE